MGSWITNNLGWITNAQETDTLSLHLSQDNWFNDPNDWITWETSNTITFNSSKLATQFFNASTIDVITGTPQGAIIDLRSYNNIPYNVSEVEPVILTKM